MTKNQQSMGAVVMGGDFQGLGVIRSLAEDGIPVFLLEHEWSIGRYSRYVKRRAVSPSALDGDAGVDFLIKLAKEEQLKGWILFPNNDETVKFLAINRDRLSEWFRVPVPSWETTRLHPNPKNVPRKKRRRVDCSGSYFSASAQTILQRGVLRQDQQESGQSRVFGTVYRRVQANEFDH